MNNCVCCGVGIPEGRQVCYACEAKGSSPINDKTDIAMYVKEKVKILKQLCIKVTHTQIAYMLSRKTEFDVDAFAHDLILGRSRIL